MGKREPVNNAAQKAFDKVPHMRLAIKIRVGHVLTQIEHWFSDLMHRVEINGSYLS